MNSLCSDWRHNMGTMLQQFRFTAPMAAFMTASALQKRVEECKRGLATPVQTAEPDFGERLKVAVKQRLAARHGRAGVIASASEDDEQSFGKKLTDAVKKRLASRGHEGARQRAEREKARYRRVTRRAPAKSG